MMTLGRSRDSLHLSIATITICYTVYKFPLLECLICVITKKIFSILCFVYLKCNLNQPPFESHHNKVEEEGDIESWVSL